MQPAKGLSIVLHVKTVAGAAIALRMAALAAYAAKKKRPDDFVIGTLCLPYSNAYLIMIFCVSLSLLLLSVTISM